MQPAVLIVDPYREAAEALGTLLRLEGYEVAVASTGREAVDRLRAEPGYRLELLDAATSEDEALAFRDERRAAPEAADVPMVALAWPRGTPPPLDADAYLPSPVDPVRLLALVDRYCPRRG